MSNEEFENYVALMGKLLQFTSEQRDQISGELQDHLQMRVADLIGEGVAKPDAISQALEEFGDAAVMAQNFQTVLKLNRRRWMMRFATYSIAGAFLAAILTMAMWPGDARFGSPNKSLAQAESKAQDELVQSDETTVDVSDATQRTLFAEEALRKVVSFDYKEVPFDQIEKELEEITGLNILVHGSAQNDSLTSKEPITFSLRQMPLNKALNMLLETKNATYVIDEGVVVIISLDDAEDAKWFRLKMYDCRELVNALSISPTALVTKNRRPKQDQGEAQTSSSESDLLDQMMGQTYDVMKAQAEKEQTLLDLVQHLIQPDTWQDTGQGLGQVEVVNGILVVSQTEAILQEIENFVADLEGNVLQKNKRGAKVRASSTATSSNVNPLDAPKTSKADPFGAGGREGFGNKDPFGAEQSSGTKDPFGN